MRTLIRISKGWSGILLLSLLIVYGSQNVQAESSADVLLASTADWWSDEWGASRSIAWGDVDGDGDLDLAVANANEVNRVYINKDGILELEASWSSIEKDASYSIAWGDVDGDGDLDLAAGNVPNSYLDSEGQNRIYLNDNGTLTEQAAWSSAEGEATYSIAWGDVDNDGDLDLAAGNQGANRLYLNNIDQAGINPDRDQIYLETGTSWSSIETEETRTVVWGDLDNDGDLDLAAGNLAASNHIYLNVKGQLQAQSHWQSQEIDETQSLAWADVNNDGYLDMAAGNDGANRLYFNQNGSLQNIASWSTVEEMNTHAISWGDLDGDGDLDLAIANGSGTDEFGFSSERQPNQFYLNDAGTLKVTSWLSDEADDSYNLAWGDVDGDDDLDLAVGSGGVRRVYYNEGNVLQPIPAWSDDQATPSVSVAWGDMDGDGDLDLAVGNRYKPNRVYLNRDGILESTGWVAEISSETTSLAWGDIDGDHDLDLAVGNRNGPNYVYENLGTMLDVDPLWTSDQIENTASVAWGDMDGDGDLDLAVGNGATGSTRVPNRVYINIGKTLESSASWSSKPAKAKEGEEDEASEECEADEKGVASEEGVAGEEGIIGEEDVTNSIAWGDLDGDGDLDLAAGNGGINRIYRNENNILQERPCWSSEEEDRTMSVAWGDVDNDGDLDLAVGNAEEPNRIYLNDGERLRPTAYWSSLEADHTKMLGWGDVNGDGNLDLAVGNYGEPSQVYINLNGRLQEKAVWQSGEADKTTAIAWGDVDNDGDLDLAVSNEGNNRVYVGKARQYPQKGSAYIHIAMPSATQNLQNTEVGASADTTFLTTPADFYATTRVWKTAEIPIAYTLFDPSGEPARFVKGFYSLDGGGNWLPALPITNVQESAVQPTIRVNNTYRGGHTGIEKTPLNTFDVQPASAPKTSLAHPLSEAQAHRFMLPLVMKNGAPTILMPEPVNRAFVWDTLASGSVGQSDNVVFRLEAHLSGANSFQRATVGAQTYPFRVRSLLQPRVQTEAGVNAADALVYRLPFGQTQGATPFANNNGTPYRTDQRGYLQGRGQLVAGDQLMAILPVDKKPIYSGKGRGPYRVYETSAQPDASGLQFQTVELSTDQIMKVSPTNPLILFDLDISLEWDARSDNAFRAQLMSDLKRTARILYDWTNGQATLGEINVYQDRAMWNAAHIRIYASNTLRPNADIGGIVSMLITETVTLGSPSYVAEPSPYATPTYHSEPALAQASMRNAPAISPDRVITYGPGQVRMGANWNRFGDASGSTLSEDWPRTLAHELGHYLFFLDDNYLGVNSYGQLISITNCPGAMSDPYQGEDGLGYDEFHPDNPLWESRCAQTFSNIRTGRSDWATIAKFYPWFNMGENSGPSTLPLEVTQVAFIEPETVQAAGINNMPLESPIFFVTESRNGISTGYEPSPQARAILFQEASNWLIDLGRPELDQIYARGARVGDRLCVIDSYDSVGLERTFSHLMGCQTIQFGDERIELREWTDWQPEILVKPIDKDTIEVWVDNIDVAGVTVQARLYPKNDAAGPAQPMTFDPQTDSYRTTFDTATTVENRWESGTEMISVTALSGHIHIWLDDPMLQREAEETEPRREMVTSYSIGSSSSSFAFQTIGYAYSIRGYANQFRGYAPIASDDGHVMVFSPDSEQADNGIYAIQTATYIPSIPPEATLVGQGYRLIAADETSEFDRLSINMGYLGREVPPGKEEHLIIHYLNDDRWLPLDTQVDARQNNAVAQAPGPGLYALMVRISISLDQEWNAVSFPVQGTQSVAEALASIADKYQVIYYYDAQDKANPWQIHAPNLPSWFGSLTPTMTDFEFGEVYWIYMTEPVSWFVRSEDQFDGIVAGQLNVPPAVYYGKLPSGLPAGTTVTAWIGDEECGTTEAQEVQTVNGPEIAFVIDVIDTFSKAGCGKPESNIIFGTGDIAKGADDATGNATWDNSQIQEVNLTITDK